MLKKTLHRFIYCGLLSIACLCSALTNASEFAQTVTQSTTAIKGEFSQSKNLKPLKRPFKSTGSFVYYPENGLLWQTLTPINSVKLFAKNGVFKLNKQGVMEQEAQLDNDFFLALFSGDEQQLMSYFSVSKKEKETANTPDAQQSPTRAATENCLVLIPLSDTLRSLFKAIELCLADDLVISAWGNIPKKITLIEANGNSTEINLRHSKQDVSQQELSYFD